MLFQVDRLQHVFEKTYSFVVVRGELTNLGRASHQLNLLLSSFMNAHDEPDTLLLFYYAGHGICRDNTLHLVG